MYISICPQHVPEDDPLGLGVGVLQVSRLTGSIHLTKHINKYYCILDAYTHTYYYIHLTMINNGYSIFAILMLLYTCTHTRFMYMYKVSIKNRYD